MRTLFRSMPWNSRRGQDSLTRVWLPRLLIVTAILLTVRSSAWLVRGTLTNPLYLLMGSVGFGVLLVRPGLAMFLIPIAVIYPRTIPRLFGSIGILEVLLPLMGVAWVGNLALHRRQIRTNEVLGLALLTAVPIVASVVSGRGDQDWARAQTWLAGCGTYLLALNLVHNRPTAEKMLLWAALAIVGTIGLDFLGGGGASALQDPSSDLFHDGYRHTALGIGQNNSVAGLLGVVMPILVAYALLAPDRRQRGVGVIGVFLGVLVGMLLLSRTFWAIAGIGLVAQVYAIWRTRGGRRVLVTLLLIGASVWLISLLVPNMAELSRRQLEGTFSIGGRVEGAVGTRMELSVIQLREAARSLLWGHGSSLATSRFAHATIPTALYDYGLMFTLPLLGVLGLWLRQAIRLVRDTNHEDDSAFSVAHLGSVVGIVGIMFLNDFLITNISYLCLAFLIAGSLGATMSDQEQEPVRAV